MRPSLLRRIQQAGVKLPQHEAPVDHSPYTATKKNLLVNSLITTLYGYGLYSIYKDYKTTKLNAIRTSNNPAATVPSTFEGRMEEIHNRPNRVFNSDEVKESAVSTPMRVLKSLTYGDISELSVAWGVLIQLCNTAHVTYGTKSLIYRSSLLGVLAYPPILYYFFRERLFDMESKGVIIN